MSPEQRGETFLAAMAGLFILYQIALRSIRCQYCGRINGHEDHCPYSGTGVSGGST